MNDKTKALLDRAPEIMAALLCDKTMECCGKAKQCPYHSTDYNHISVGYGCDVDRLDADTAGLLKAYAAQLAAVTAERDAASRLLNDLWKMLDPDGLEGGYSKAATNMVAYLIYDKIRDYQHMRIPSWRGPQGAGEGGK